MSRSTIARAVVELEDRKKLAVAARGRIRVAGGGRKKVEDADPGLQDNWRSSWNRLQQGIR
jgi:hypothetical protein